MSRISQRKKRHQWKREQRMNKSTLLHVRPGKLADRAIIEAVMPGPHPSLSWLGVSRKCHRPCTVIVEGRRHGGGEVK